MDHTKKNASQQNAILPMTGEDAAVTWEKGKAAMEKWPLFST